MRILSLALVVVLSGCTDDPCEAKSGKTSCGYCAQDRATTSNPHAGMCRYCGGSVICSGDVCTDALMCNDRVFLSIPGATFHSGAMPSSSSTSTAPPVVSVSPSSQHPSVGSTVRWTVHWDVTLTVTAVLFEVTSLGGYYQLPLTTDQSNSGTVEVPFLQTAEAPGDCAGCWVEAPGETTTGEAQVALAGAGGGLGPPFGGLNASWDRHVEPQSRPTNTGGGGGSSGCPTSGAQLGCCTTTGGIQVLGFGLSTACTCPSDTCAPHAGYCGCRACGGC